MVEQGVLGELSRTAGELGTLASFCSLRFSEEHFLQIQGPGQFRWKIIFTLLGLHYVLRLLLDPINGFLIKVESLLGRILVSLWRFFSFLDLLLHYGMGHVIRSRRHELFHGEVEPLTRVGSLSGPIVGETTCSERVRSGSLHVSCLSFGPR